MKSVFINCYFACWQAVNIEYLCDVNQSVLSVALLYMGDLPSCHKGNHKNMFLCHNYDNCHNLSFMFAIIWTFAYI